jgi:hypothetical protein
MRNKLGKIFSYSSGEQKSADAWNDSHSLGERSSKGLISTHWVCKIVA